VSRKSRGKKKKVVEAVPEEILAEGSGPVEGAVAHVGIDTIAADEPEPATVEELAVAVEELAAVADEVLEAAAEAAAELLAAEVGEAVDAAEQMADAVEGDATLEAAEPAVDADLAAAPDALEEISDEEAAEIGATLPTSAASMDAAQLKFLVEALVFASDKPMTLLRLRQLTRVSDTRRLEQSLAELAEDYKDRGIVLQQVSGGYQFRTRTQFSSWVQQLIAGRPVRLSRAQLETLAIIAYRQPITRPEIDEIRGVDSSATLKLLLDRSLIRILGKKEEVGRPMLYGTTKEFLDFFSLGDLRELPTLREYSELTDESRRVMSDELGIDPDDDDPDGSGGEGGGGGGDGGGESGEPVEVQPETIESLVASYSASMDSDDAAPTGVFEARDDAAPTGVFPAEPALSSLDSLAARRLASDDADVDSDAVSPDVDSDAVVLDVADDVAPNLVADGADGADVVDAAADAADAVADGAADVVDAAADAVDAVADVAADAADAADAVDAAADAMDAADAAPGMVAHGVAPAMAADAVDDVAADLADADAPDVEIAADGAAAVAPELAAEAVAVVPEMVADDVDDNDDVDEMNMPVEALIAAADATVADDATTPKHDSTTD